MRTKVVVTFLVAMFLLFASSLNAEMRKWTRKNGQEFQAEFVKVENKVVTLRTPDGKEITVKMPGLSEEDRNYVKQHRTSGKAEGDSKEPSAVPEKPAKKPDTKKHSGKSDSASKEKPDVADKETPTPQPEEPSSGQPKTMIVEAKGSGKDRDEAIKDAFRDAVRKVVGAYVEEETVIKNDQVIKDQVLTYSGGCVKTHGIVAEKSDAGVVQVTIWALVEQDKVVKRLKAASVSVKDVAGGKIWDEIQSKRWKDMQAADLLRSVLKGFPANCMRAEVVGQPKHVDKGNKIEVTLVVQFHADEQAYKAFRERLMAVLDHVADGSKDFLLTFGDDKRGGFSSQDMRITLDKGSKEVFLFVNTSRNELWTRLGWKVYRLDSALEPVLTDVARRTCECVLSSQDTSGNSQPISTFQPGDGHRPLTLVNPGIASGPKSFLIANTFVSHYFHPYLKVWHHPKAIYEQKLDMTEDEVKNLSKIKCELRFSESQTRR
jgi:hypothetical protein